MGAKTEISWTDATWNCIRGCTRVSEGCRHCYAEAIAARFSGPGQPYEGLATKNGSGAHWTGEVRLIEHLLEQPLHWRTPKRIFVNSMSDLFHEAVPAAWIAAIFGVMAATPHHIYQVLTKRAERMPEWFQWIDGYGSSRWCIDWAEKYCPDERPILPGNSPDWPLSNVWLGASVENQRMMERIRWLQQTPARVRFLSLEPLLEGLPALPLAGISWVIIGGESGPHRRPMRLEWLESIVEQCQATGIAVFVKQDSALRPGQQGRIPDRLWIHEFPNSVQEVTHGT